MTEEIKDAAQDQTVAPADEAAQPVDSDDEGRQTIRIELDDLSDEARERIEEETGRKIEDVAYAVTSTEDREGSVRVLTISVERDVYAAEQQRLLNDLRKEVTLPGFRKGKAPLKLLQIRMGAEAGRDTIRSLATNALRQEKSKLGAELVANPEVTSHDVPEAADGAVTFEVEVELEPTVELKQYKDFKVEVEVQAIGDEAVDQRIEQMRQTNAVLEAAPEGAEINPGDQVVVDIEVTNDKGERLEHLCAEARTITNPAQELPEAIAADLAGKKVGDELTAQVANEVTTRTGKAVTHEDAYKVTIREIKVQKLPDLDDEFAKDLGEYDSLADLRKGILDDLEKSEERSQRAASVNAIVAEIVKANPVDPPRSFLARQQYNLIMQDTYQLQRYGLSLDQVVQDPDKYVADQRATALDQVKAQLLLAELSKIEKIEVTDEHVDAEIARLAEESGRKPLAVRARLEAEKQLDELRQRLERTTVEDFLLANNTVEKVAAKPAAAKPAAAPAEEAPAEADEAKS